MVPGSSSSPFTSGAGFRPDSSTPNPIEGDRRSDVAIIGFSFQLPQADSPDSFWKILTSGKCTATAFPPSRFHNTKYFADSKDHTGAIRAQKASFLQRDIRAFDASFFSMTQEEASGTDPQQRILLETTYHALENAGIPVAALSGSDTSVYVGCFTMDYAHTIAKDPEFAPKYSVTGGASSMLSNRISKFLGLTGTSITIDTACSSSLVALDLACQSVIQGKSKIGIAAGCNLLLTVDLFTILSNLSFLSPDGVCHSFDNRANGYGRGEGFGVLIVKSLDDALQNGDTIRAVIRATGTNQNGHTNLAQPSKEMQRQLIERTYRKANIDMSQTRFFEAHGTGTAIGDPIEAMAIGEAFGSHRDQNDPLIVGSVKANIGHLEGAAGIAAVIKTILVLERGVIPPVAQLGELNENIDANFLHLKFPRTPIPWPHPGLRRASVNSFGFGGTNAHVIIDDAFSYLAARELVGNHCTTTTTPTESSHNPSRYSPKVQPDIENHRDSSLGRIPLLFTWSAKDSGSINRMTQVYKEYLEQATRHKEIVDGDLGSLAYTLSRRRSLYSWRTFAAANSVSHLIEKLAAMGETIQSVSNRKAAFVFTGQGAQWAGMGKELLSFPMFRSNVLEADEFLQGIGCGWKASDFLLHAEDTLPKINKPQFSQPLCTILQVAIVELLRSFRIYPLVVVGHSSGEIAAAYTTGAICRQSAWKLAYFRGLVSDELDQSSDESTRGAMMAVGASESLLRPYVEEILAEAQGGILCTACLNSPQNTTLAGDRSLIESLKTRLSKVGFFTSILKVPVAYHSPHMARIAPTYRQLIGNLIQEKTSTPHVSMVSSVTGSIISGSELRSPEYWVKNMTSQVRFSDAIERIFRDSTRRLTKKLDMSHRNHLAASDLVEIGPHSALKGPIREISQASRSQLSYTPTLVRGESASMALLNTIGTLHCRGFDVDLAGINRLCGMTKKIPKVLPSLPGYPYDHSGTYWSEPRIARNMRLKPFPYNEFLGLPVADWNPLQPRWRNTLKTTSIAWLEEHQINGEILYPAAGMLVMAIEAITQISHGREITGYELRNVEFRSRLSIPANDIGKEVQFSLSLSEDASSWSSFSLFACGDEFTEICRGDAKAIFETHVSLCSVEEGVRKANHIRDLIAAVDSSREAEMHSTGFYQLLSRNGYRYGPSFQGVRRSVRNNCGEEVGDVSIWRHAVNSSTMPPSVIHPCTLDSIVQLVIPGDPQVHKKKIATWLPTYITRLWISSSGFNQPTGKDRIRVYVAKQPMSARLNSWSVFTADGDSRGLLEIKGLQTTLVADNTQDAVSTATQQQARRLCYDVVWKPDHTLHDTDLMSQYIRDYASTEFGPTKFSPILKIFILGSIFRAERKVSESTIPVTTPHLQKQYAWIQKQTSLIRKILPSSRSRDTPWFAEEPLFNYLRDYMKASGRIGEIYVAFDRHIVNIFQGTTDAPQFLLRDNLLQEYSWLLIEDAQFHGALHRYVDALAHKTPGIKILGVEAGFGAVTKSIIKILSTPTTNGLFCRFSRCDIASPSQPIEISSKGDDPISNTYFCAFDIEEPIQCGFEENSYDLILLVNVLHMVRSFRDSLKNIRKLLRNDGKLVIIDFTNPGSVIGPSILGYLPEWWHYTETWPKNGQSDTIAQWSQELKESGFSGVDILIHDSDFEQNQLASLIISSADMPPSRPEDREPTNETPVLVVTGFHQPSRSWLAEQFSLKLHTLGFTDVRPGSFHEASVEANNRDKIIVIIQDREWLSLQSVNAQEYSILHNTLGGYSYVLWISEVTTGRLPQLGTVQGLSRALRMENHGLVLATVSLDISRVAVMSENIEKLLRNFLQGVHSGLYEPELVQIGDLLHIPRVYECDALNQKVHEFSSETIEVSQRFGQRNVKLKVRQIGLLDTLYFEEVPDLGSLPSNEVEIEVRAVGVNFKDYLVSLGRVHEDTIGCECSGVVLSAGSQCHLQRGDRVVVLASDTFRGRVRCREELATKIPNEMPFTTAAALGVNFVTAHHALVVIGRLCPGESVLIHSGAGGTGQAAIQIAKLYGAHVITTVGSMEKKALLNSLYDIPLENILYSRDLSFADGIKRLTRNRGVDIVLNSLAEDALIASWECLAPYGRFIEIGKKDIFSHNKLPMFQFARNTSFSALDVAAMGREKPALLSKSLISVMDLFGKNLLRPASPLKLFSISQVESAFRHFQSGTNPGKVVVEVDQDNVITATIHRKSTLTFSSQETFVIAGGLGGQGRSIARWMVSRGARNLVLLSRTGPQNNQVESFLNGLKRNGANVYTPRCDIANATSLGAALGYCRLHMPPIKGCIQAAMDIKDSIFENMTYEAWIASLRPKTLGSWNLHEQLPRDLDFFVMFSSISGIIGSQGQSNYAAGNTYQDELARYRLNRGEKAISLDLGILASDGYIAENQEALFRFVNIKQMLLMSEDEVLSLLEYYCDKDLPVDRTRSQLVLGLDLPADIISRGMEPSRWTQEPMFANLHQMTPTAGESAEDSGLNLVDKVASTASLPEATDILANGIADKLSTILSIPLERFGLGQPLYSSGVDSLIALELRNWFGKALKVDMPIFEILGGATAITLGRAAAEKMRTWS